MRSVRLLLLTSSMLILFPGCAYSPVIYRPGLVEQRNLRRPTVSTAPPINLVLRTKRTTYYGWSAPWHFQVISGWKTRRALYRATEGFPWLANAKAGLANARYQLIIEATDAIRASLLRDLLTALAFLIPQRMEWSLGLKAQLDDGGRAIGTYESYAQCTIHEHLLFLPLSFKAARITEQVRENTFRDLFLQIEQDKANAFVLSSDDTKRVTNSPN